MPKLLLLFVVCAFSCDSSQRTPSPPPVPDIPLPAKTDAGEPDPAEGKVDGGVALNADEFRPPIAQNMLEFLPEVLDGVRARRRQKKGQKPSVYGFYEGENRRIYNLHITGPTETEASRRSKNSLLGKEEFKESGPLNIKGFKLENFDAQRTYNTKKKKSETMVLVNQFVEVKLSVAPTDDPDESTKHLSEVDLVGISKLQ